MIDNLLEADSLNAHGKITRRQTTFWDVVLTDSGPHRIYFRRKHEFFFHGEDFLGFAVYDNYPLLMDYVEEWGNVYLASTVEDTEPLISRLSQAVADLTGNWRPVYRYLNSCFDTRALLQSGNGLLLAGPRTIVDGISPLFAEYGVAISILKGMPARGAPRVLVLGSNFVIAESFESKTLPRTRHTRFRKPQPQQISDHLSKAVVVFSGKLPHSNLSRPGNTYYRVVKLFCMMVSMSQDGREFTPTAWLRNPHFMTVFPGYWPRRGLLAGVPTESRLFTTEPHTQLLGFCHWQPARTACQTLVLVHGLEGSSESHYMYGIAAKAYRAGFNVIRMNQRTCGGTERLTPTLYNTGLSQDYRAIIQELAHVDGLKRIWFVGYSMGGNLVLKATGEAGSSETTLAGAIAVCPNIDPPKCVEALEQPRNWIYHRHFLVKLKERLQRKAALFPGKWDLKNLDNTVTMSQFDHRFTAPDGGYASGADYYNRVGACHVVESIAVPTLIITAQDDPFIPYSMFTMPPIQRNSRIRVIAPRYGGHCGFLQWAGNGEDHFWAENRIIDFLQGRI